jgi:hypothetical protein
MEEHQQHLIILYDLDSFKAFTAGKSHTVSVYLKVTSNPEQRVSGAMEYAKEVRRKLVWAATIKCNGYKDVTDKYIKSRFANRRYCPVSKNGVVCPTNIYMLNSDDLKFLMNLPENFEVEKL